MPTTDSGRDSVIAIRMLKNKIVEVSPSKKNNPLIQTSGSLFEVAATFNTSASKALRNGG
jgi:hypothetical protein